MPVFWLFLTLALDNPIPLGEYELFDPHAIATIHRVGDHWLICDMSEAKLLLIDEKGALAALYHKQGQGPGELEQPWVMGVDRGEIFVANNLSDVVVFDDKLNLLKRELPSLTVDALYRSGFCAGPNEFYLLAFFSSGPPLVKRIKLENGEWQVLSRFLDQRLTRAEMIKAKKSSAAASKVDYHNGMFFYEPESYEDDYYEVFGYTTKGLNSERIDISFSNELDGYEPIYRGFYAVIYAVGRMAEGYVLEIKTKKNGEKIMFHDYYDLNGKFVARVEMPDTKLIPSLNSPDLFLWRDNEESPTLERFDFFPKKR